MATPLATVGDLEGRLGRTFDVAETARATLLLQDASAAVRGYTGQQFTEATTTVRVKPRKGLVRLPQRPVTAVTAVEDTNGNAVLHTWRGDDTVSVSGNTPDTWAWEPWRNGLTSVDVTYTHGYDEVPDDIIAVVCQIAGRAMGHAADTTGMQSETIGEYSYSVGAAAAAGGLGLLNDERAVLDRYRRPAGLILQ